MFARANAADESNFFACEVVFTNASTIFVQILPLLFKSNVCTDYSLKFNWKKK